MNIVFFGLSITSSWGNGHATTYRGLLRELAHRGHKVWFFESNQSWYAPHRDLENLQGVHVRLYDSLFEVREILGETVACADAVIVGSYVPEGIALGRWVTSVASGVTAFYDIDTPVTARALESEACHYLDRELIGVYDIYLSFTGGPLLDHIRKIHGARSVAPLYCSVDPQIYFPECAALKWDLGYLGTYAADRQPMLDELLLAPARKMKSGHFVVAGPQYPDSIRWPANVRRIEHLGPGDHRAFYAAQRFTLNVTRCAMVSAGYSPSVRLFEAAACGVPIISDRWPGIESFFTPGEEILLADSSADVTSILRSDAGPQIADRARGRILSEHTAAHRARELETLLNQAVRAKRSRSEEVIP